METQAGDPYSTAVLVGFIATLLGVIYRELRGQIADRDAQIKKLEQGLEKAAERSASLASSAERMLTYFLDREERRRSDSGGFESERPP